MIKSSIYYVVTNIIVMIAGFLKSFYIMKYLGFSDVGILSLVQALLDLLGMMHVGLINGAYRQYFQNTDGENTMLNNLMHSAFFVLFLLFLVCGAIYALMSGNSEIPKSIPYILAFSGTLALCKNWVNNVLIAQKKINQLNLITIISALGPMLFLPLLPVWGIWAGILAFVTQPLLFISFAFFKFRYLIPTSLSFSKVKLAQLLSIGFIPFVISILVKFIDQIERWGIIDILGFEALGRYNIVVIYCSTFILVPASLTSLIHPYAIRAYQQDRNKFHGVIIKFSLLLVAYITVTFIITYFFLEPIISNFLPKYLIGINYVWLAFPFLAFTVMSYSFNLIYTTAIKYKGILLAYSLGTLIMAGTTIIGRNQIHSLSFFPLLKGCVSFVFFTVLLSYFLLHRKTI